MDANDINHLHFLEWEHMYALDLRKKINQLELGLNEKSKLRNEVSIIFVCYILQLYNIFEKWIKRFYISEYWR